MLAGALAIAVLTLASPSAAQASCSKSADPVNRISKDNARAAIQCLFNKMRSAPNVKRHGDLERAAQNHSSTMASQNCYSHQCPGEPRLDERVARTGYLRGADGWKVSEVILRAPDQVTSRRIVNAFEGSPSHRSTIVESSYDHVGVGLSFRRGLVYVTADFGHR